MAKQIIGKITEKEVDDILRVLDPNYTKKEVYPFLNINIEYIETPLNDISEETIEVNKRKEEIIEVNKRREERIKHINEKLKREQNLLDEMKKGQKKKKKEYTEKEKEYMEKYGVPFFPDEEKLNIKWIKNAVEAHYNKIFRKNMKY